MKVSIQRVLIFVALASIGFNYEVSAGNVGETTHTVQIKKLYLPEENSTIRKKPITHIMLHFISNISNLEDNPYQITAIYFLLKDLRLSTHYVIDREGDVFQLVPENRVAYHAGKSNLPNLPFFIHNMNDYSIGIELMGIGTKEEMASFIPEAAYDAISPNDLGFTEQQYRALSSLIQDILKRNPTIPNSRWHIIGHEDYAAGRKVDPGQLFDWCKLGF
ncbi:N-acetylmuramoyl-L-alanine amidase [Ornithinibacillus contaminans]|uniref:N-acetylmuramoyl-L-alanine amidase n=1 Tax=Ornithinibacillus contaminans TaxID=694055 RepID=UPI00064D8D21|nr:N-acetylmuramoyl-L-alanine amidase [Ornithinibacillus contaminans]